MIYLNRAEEFGFAAFGIAPAIDEVRAVFDWAESVVVGAVSYLPPEPNPIDNQPRGLIARVARSSDYHIVLREKLSRFASALLLEYPGARLEICVDTNPLPERKLAMLAGVAWRGRNGNVFTDGCGSYISIGEIVTDIKLPASEPMLDNRCEKCDKCVRACPAQAITGFGVIDTARCVSGLTQSSGIIPRDLTSSMGNHIYGCDICQEVCPQNANIKSVSPDFAHEAYPGAHSEIVPLIRLSAEEFKNTLKNSSIGWIRRTRIRRNAAIVAGNLKSEEAIPALEEMLCDDNSVLRTHAAWALDDIKLNKHNNNGGLI